MSASLRNLSDQLIADIRKCILLGMPPRLAAESLGVPRTSFRRWVSIGDTELAGEETVIWRQASPKQRKLCAKLAEAISQAKAEMMKQCMANLRKKSVDGAWQIDAWLLERLYPQFFANRLNLHARVKQTNDKATVREALAQLAAEAECGPDA